MMRKAPKTDFSCGCATCTGARTELLEPFTLLVGDSVASAGGPTAAAADEGAVSVAVGGSFSGEVNSEGDTDLITVTLEAGKTYMISLRGTGASPLVDPFLQFADPNGVALSTDDDGGNGINSLINWTTLVAGTYQITAGALAASGGTGGYTVDVREMATDTVPGDLSSTVALPIGVNVFGFIEEFGEADVYKLTLTAGNLYTFDVAGGADYNTNYLAVPPGELDTKLTLYDAAGNQVAFSDDINFSPVPGEGDISSAIGYSAAATGTYYLRVEAYESNAGGGTGGYALVSSEMVLDALEPVDAIDWGTQLPSTAVTVYFAGPGEIYDGIPSAGWTDYEIQQAMLAFETWADVTDLTFTRTMDSSTATFKLVTTADPQYLGYFNPPGTANQGVGVFSLIGTGWDRLGTDGGLEQGGYGWITLIHEFGHGIGLAHPHDNGGTSQVMPGVTGPFDSYGVYDLNQGVYTTMSYNDGWQTHPDADSNGEIPGAPVAWGFQGGPGAFDIQAVQAKYGADSGRGAGDTVYVLPTENVAGTFWTAIWDVSGLDSIVHNGAVSALIDLTAATLDYTPTGGGVISFVEGIFGGFTIAGGVVIENATGGSAADVLIGNSAANLLNGRGGADSMVGRSGDDTYIVDDAGDVVLEKSGEGSDEIRTDLADHTIASQVEKLTGTRATGTQILRGDAVANILAGAAASNLFRLEHGGDDTASGGAGNDAFIFGAALTAADQADGGEGKDQLGIQGNYDLTLGAGNLVGIETLALLSGTDTRFGDSGTHRYDYELTAVDANVAAGQVLTVNFNTLQAGEDVTFDGSAEGNGSLFFYGGAGLDKLTGGAVADAFLFGDGLFDAAHRIVGGGGADQLGLRGNYVLTFQSATMSGVETLALLSGKDTRFGALGPDYGYAITLHNDNVASGQQLSINASQLRAGETLSLDGSAELDGTLRVLAGQGNDTVHGGAMGDFLFGGLGQDSLRGAGGADTYFYRVAAESTSTGYDRIDGFDFAVDKLDLPGTHNSYGQVAGGTLNSGTFDANLASAMTGALDPSEAIFFTPNAGSLAGRLFLVVDQNGIAGYQAGEDFVFELLNTSPPTLPPPDFIV